MKQVIVKIVLLAFLQFCVLFAKGNTFGDQNQVGAREVSLGNASAALISAFSVFHNQAALAWINQLTVAIDYRQPYLIDGFAEKSLAVVVPTKVSNFAFSLQQKGIQGYSESRFGFAMAKTFGLRVSAGMQFNYFLIDFPEQGNQKGTFLIEFGMFYRSANSLAMGLHIFNPAGASVGGLNLKSKLPVSAIYGLSLKPSTNLLLAFAIAYIVDDPLSVRMGVEYQFGNSFFLRGGISGKPIRHSAGMGYKLRFFQIDMAFVHHESLGYTPSITCALNF